MDERLKTPTEWINIGDVNPERHGGIFVKWKGNYWHIIRTTHFADLPDGLTENEYMFEHRYMYPDEIFQDPSDIGEGFTKWAYNQLDTFASEPFEWQSIGNRDLIPDSVSYKDHINWVLDNQVRWILTSLAFAYSGYYGDHSSDFDSDYWGYLSYYDIDKSDF